ATVWRHESFFVQAEDGIRHLNVTGVQTCALPISTAAPRHSDRVAYSVEDLAIETMLPERSPAWIRSTSRSSERTPFAPGPAPGSWTWRVRPSGASASPRSGSAW